MNIGMNDYWNEYLQSKYKRLQDPRYMALCVLESLVQLLRVC